MGQLVVNGLALGSIYALVALGLLLIFNTVQIVNFAQGQDRKSTRLNSSHVD